MVAQQITVDRPDLVLKLVLVETAPRNHEAGKGLGHIIPETQTINKRVALAHIAEVAERGLPNGGAIRRSKEHQAAGEVGWSLTETTQAILNGVRQNQFFEGPASHECIQVGTAAFPVDDCCWWCFRSVGANGS